MASSRLVAVRRRASAASPECYADFMIDETLLAAEGTSEGIRPIKRVEYERMVECGIFADERVELLEGFLVRMSPQGGPHADSVAMLHERLTLALHGRAKIRSHSPFAASDDSEPEPDIAVVPPGDYSKSHPDRAFLLVEAADSSLAKDRGIKARLYARSGVREYWILDLKAGRIEIHREPGQSGFAQVSYADRAASLSLEAFPDVSIAASSFLPKP